MSKFKIISDFKPAGDQPAAIEALSSALERGDKHQVLLGVTGSGKTFTIANVIEKVGRPTLVLHPTKPLLPSYTRNSRNSSQIMPSVISFPTMTTTSPRPICLLGTFL